MWPWCDKVFPRTLWSMAQPKASVWQRGSWVPPSPTARFSCSLCFVTSGLTVPLAPRPWRCSCGQSLQPSLVHPPEPGARPLWEQGPAAWRWWGVCPCWLGARSRLGILAANLYGVPLCPGFHLFGLGLGETPGRNRAHIEFLLLQNSSTAIWSLAAQGWTGK